MSSAAFRVAAAASSHGGGHGGSGAPGGVLGSAGVFAALPASPVYALEEWEVEVYANTAGNSLEAYSVELYYDPALLEYVRHVGSDRFNNIVFEDMGTFLVLNPVGKPASVDDIETTGSAVYLATVTMRFQSGATRGFGHGL